MPPSSTVPPKSKMWAYAWETETLPANIWKRVSATWSTSRTDPLVTSPRHSRARRMFAFTSPINAPNPGFSSIFDHHNAWRRNTENVIPPIGALIVVTVADGRRMRAAYASRCRVAYERQPMLENTANAGIGESRVWQSHLESFNRAGNNACAQATQLFKASRIHLLNRHRTLL